MPQDQMSDADDLVVGLFVYSWFIRHKCFERTFFSFCGGAVNK